MVTQGVMSKAGGKVIALMLEKFPTDILILGLPYYLAGIISLAFLIITYYADALYRLDLNIVYGRQFKKMEELLSDMKTLRNHA